MTAELRAQVTEVMRRREEALRVARQVEPGESLELARRNHAELVELTRQLNEAISPVAAASPIRYGQPQPRQGPGRAIWLYKAARQIEAYNASRAGEMCEGEREVLRLVNEYREALGILPLEFDERLRDAARGHARWMRETGVFSHDSDLPGLRTHGQRMDRAGYRWRGSGENLAFGDGDAGRIFWSWFDSTSHHRTMVGDWVHLGVGRDEMHWVQKFGIGEPARAVRFRAGGN